MVPNSLYSLSTPVSNPKPYAASDSFVLSNGIFMTGGYGSKNAYSRVGHIPVSGARLDKVVAVNQLSREIEEGKYECVEMAKQKLDEISKMPANKNCFLMRYKINIKCSTIVSGVKITLLFISYYTLLYVL